MNVSANYPMIRYVVDMPVNTFLGIGYGVSMDNTDLVAFVANEKNPTVLDLFAHGEYLPPIDDYNNYITSIAQSTEGPNRLTFTSVRAFQTNDS